MKTAQYILPLLLLVSQFAQSQTLNELKERKQKTSEEINFTNRLLSETNKNSKVTLNKLAILNQQIELRAKLLDDYNSQLNLIQSSINDNQFIVDALIDDLKKIRHEYAMMVQQAYRNRDDYNQLLFLLSSESFNQAYKRLLYTRQMARYRQRQAYQIEAIREILQMKIDDLNARKFEKEEILTKQKVEFSQIKIEKEKQSEYHLQLKQREKELKETLRKQRKIEESLQEAIEKMISEEAKKSTTITQSSEQKVVSGNFEKNKGILPWPTNQGIITDRFGEHAHPVMKNIIIRNDGIDITTSPGEKAYSVFAGTVSRVFAIPGGNMAVIIRHGQYITVYSNLTEVYVKQGNAVSLKQEIGLIYSDPHESDKTVLKFQIRKEILKLDPEDWILK